MTLSYDGKKLPTIKFLIFPLLLLVMLIAGIIYDVVIAGGNDFVKIFTFNHYFSIFSPSIGLLSFISIMFTVGNVRGGNRQNLLVFLNLIVMFGAIATVFLSLFMWDKKPNTILAEINTKLSPVVDEFFAQKSIKPLEVKQNPKAPYSIVEASLTIDSNGNYFFSKPVDPDNPQDYYSKKEDDSVEYGNTYAQNLHLLQIYQAGLEPDSYKSIAVIVKDWVKTGRKVQLDLGSVPEVREQVNIYIVDIATWQVITEIGPIYGSRASRPFGGPGAGTIYLTEVRGSEVKVNTIRKALDKLNWE